jgi:hypothetical protein
MFWRAKVGNALDKHDAILLRLNFLRNFFRLIPQLVDILLSLRASVRSVVKSKACSMNL